MTTETWTDAQRVAITGLTGEDGWPDAKFEQIGDNAVATVRSYRTDEPLVLTVRPDGSVIHHTLGQM